MSFSAEYTCCEPPPPPSKIPRYSVAIRHHHLSAYVNNVAHHIPYLLSAAADFPPPPSAINCFGSSVGVNVAATAAISSGYRHISHDFQAVTYTNSSCGSHSNDNILQLRLAANRAAFGGGSAAAHASNMTTITISPSPYYNNSLGGWSGKEKQVNSRSTYSNINGLCIFNSNHNNFNVTSTNSGSDVNVIGTTISCSTPPLAYHDQLLQTAQPPSSEAINVNTSLSLTTSGGVGGGNASTATAATGGTQQAGAAVALNPQLWGHLPEELVELILALLPIRAVFRMRQVCKSWKDLVLSREFGSMRADLEQQRRQQQWRQQQQQWLPWPGTAMPSPAHGIRSSWKGGGCSGSAVSASELEERYRRHGAYFLALNRSRYQQLAAYEVVSRKWCSFGLDFMPTTVAYPIAAAGGLICFLGASMETLIVCNPLTRRWKELPTMPSGGGGGGGGRRVPFSISMAVDAGGRGYKIVVAGGGGEEARTEMYDSVKGEWERCGGLPREEEIGSGNNSNSAAAACSRGGMVELGGGNLVCLARGGAAHAGSGLLAFNVQTRAWSKLMTGRIPGYSKFRHLVECGGSILVIGKALRRYVLGLYIWRLDRSTLRWREVGKMPRSICDHFFSSPSECFYCTAHGHFIFISRYFHNQAFVYNTLDGMWQQVGGCPLLTHPLLLPFSPGLDPVD